MKARAHRLFNMYTGEGSQAFLFAFLGFVLSFATSLGVKLSDALFLIHIGSQSLPYAYACIALVLIACASFIIYAFHRYTPSTIFPTVIMVGILYFGSVALSLTMDLGRSSPWLWFSLKVFNQIIFIQAISCFWTFVDQFFHFQTAKRLYTLFNSAIYIGIACAGLIIQTGNFGVTHIYELILLLMFLALFTSKKIKGKYKVLPDDTEAETLGKTPRTIRSFLKAFIRSRFALFLMLGNLVLYLLMTTTEYSYLSAFQAYFGTSTPVHGDETSFALTKFIGTCLAFVGFGNLIVGWFLYSRLVFFFGITSLIFITPLGFFVTYLGWSITDTPLFFPILGFVVVEGLYMVIEDNNFNLLLNGVPLRIKHKVRIIIESFSEPLGMLISAAILSVPNIPVKILGLILAICSLLIACCIRFQYFQAIFKNLTDHAIHLNKNIRDFLMIMTNKERKFNEDTMLQFLSNPDIELQILACDAIVGSRKKSLIEQTFFFSNNLNPKTLTHLLYLIEKTDYAKEEFVFDAIKRWESSFNDEELRAACDFFLAKTLHLSVEKKELFFLSSNPFRRGAAILALQKENQSLDRVHEEVENLLISQDENNVIVGIALLGYESSIENCNRLVEYLYSPSIKIARASAYALYECLSPSFKSLSQEILKAATKKSDSEFRIACLDAFSKIATSEHILPMILASAKFQPDEMRVVERIIEKIGEESVPILTDILVDSKIPDRSRIAASKILAQIAHPVLSAHLYDIIHKELERACFYFYYGHNLPKTYEGHDLALLKDGLLSSYQSVIDFIIYLLGASKQIENYELLVHSLRSKHDKIKSQGIETLEMCCPRPIFLLLYPLIGELPLSEKLKVLQKHTDTNMDIQAVLEKMESFNHLLDVILAVTWKYRLDIPGWQDAMRRQMAQRDDVFKHFVYELLEE